MAGGSGYEVYLQLQAITAVAETMMCGGGAAIVVLVGGGAGDIVLAHCRQLGAVGTEF